MRWLLILCICFFTAAIASAGEESVLPTPEPIAESSALPALIPALRIEGPLYFADEEVPLDNQEVRERLEKELLLTLWDRAQVILWIKRSGRYMPVIEKTLREEGLPDDLKYLAVIESALLAHIGSPKGAKGFWQFIKGTGKRYGLTINGDRDDRRNIFSSTRAASLYLKELYEMFGSWSLAGAAYNYGEFGLRKAMEAQEVDDYYRLYLPKETQRYLFRIVAAKMVLSDPGRYGFHVQEDDLYPPLEFDKVTVTSSIQTPLRLVAKAAFTYYKRIRDLNPELRSQYLPKGEHTLAIPKGSVDEFQDRYTELVAEWKEENQIRVYKVKEGDNMSLIADRFDVSLDSLLRWNNMSSRGNIFPGRELIVFQ
ncbi:MAG: transglycosylase SLT domain-containing protein [Nitrospirota bacterium]